MLRALGVPDISSSCAAATGTTGRGKKRRHRARKKALNWLQNSSHDHKLSAKSSLRRLNTTRRRRNAHQINRPRITMSSTGRTTLRIAIVVTTCSGVVAGFLFTRGGVTGGVTRGMRGNCIGGSKERSQKRGVSRKTTTVAITLISHSYACPRSEERRVGKECR